MLSRCTVRRWNDNELNVVPPTPFLLKWLQQPSSSIFWNLPWIFAIFPSGHCTSVSKQRKGEFISSVWSATPLLCLLKPHQEPDSRVADLDVFPGKRKFAHCWAAGSLPVRASLREENALVRMWEETLFERQKQGLFWSREQEFILQLRSVMFSWWKKGKWMLKDHSLCDYDVMKISLVNPQANSLKCYLRAELVPRLAKANDQFGIVKQKVRSSLIPFS